MRYAIHHTVNYACAQPAVLALDVIEADSSEEALGLALIDLGINFETAAFQCNGVGCKFTVGNDEYSAVFDGPERTPEDDCHLHDLKEFREGR